MAKKMQKLEKSRGQYSPDFHCYSFLLSFFNKGSSLYSWQEQVAYESFSAISGIKKGRKYKCNVSTNSKRKDKRDENEDSPSAGREKKGNRERNGEKSPPKERKKYFFDFKGKMYVDMQIHFFEYGTEEKLVMESGKIGVAQNSEMRVLTKLENGLSHNQKDSSPGNIQRANHNNNNKVEKVTKRQERSVMLQRMNDEWRMIEQLMNCAKPWNSASG